MLEHVHETCQCQGKICSDCGYLKCVYAFSIRTGKGHKPGARRANCKQCNCDIQKRVYAQNPEYYREKARLRRRNQPEHIRTIDRANHYRYTYGLTLVEANQILARQGGVCAICRTTEFMGPGKRPCIDHDHTTGKVRGILCQRCNTALGLFNDDIERLEAALKYVKEWNNESTRISTERTS